MQLVRPHVRYLPSFAAALARECWLEDEVVRSEARRALRQLDSDPDAFLARLDMGASSTAPLWADDSLLARTRAFTLWIWDGEFCGSIELRWYRGRCERPLRIPARIGYSVVPWKHHRSCATFALKTMLAEASELNMESVELLASWDDLASQVIITRCGGVLLDALTRPHQHATGKSCHFRVSLK